MLSARDRDRRRRIVVGRKGCPTDAGASLGLPVFSPAIARLRGARCDVLSMAAPHTRYEVQESRSHRARAVCQRLSGATKGHKQNRRLLQTERRAERELYLPSRTSCTLYTEYIGRAFDPSVICVCVEKTNRNRAHSAQAGRSHVRGGLWVLHCTNARSGQVRSGLLLLNE